MTNNLSELREKILHKLLGDQTDSEECYVDTKAKFVIDDVVDLIQQEVKAGRIDENRRSGAYWGGLVSEHKLQQGIDYMNNRDQELYNTLKEQEKGEA